MTELTMEADTRSRKMTSFNTGWLFALGNYAGAQQPDFKDQTWRKLQVPHDWSIEQKVDPDMEFGGMQAYLPRWNVGWYRKHFHIKPASANERVYIQFDGVHHNSEVWINGHFVGKRPYGYISFQYDLTPYLKWDQDNVIAVKVDNTPIPSDRWYSGSGIYRNVWLIRTHELHIAAWGTFFTTPEILSNEATVKAQIRVSHHGGNPADCTVVTEFKDSRGMTVGKSESPVTVPASDDLVVDQEIVIHSPLRWSPEQPEMYYARTTIVRDGAETDEYITPFGIREVVLDPKRGLILNGVPLKLKGVCIHHDLGCLGAAYHDQAMKRRLEKLKEMGCNAIRFAHNPMASELLDLCDRMGFLVIDEAFDKWKSLYYEHLYDDWWEKDLEAMLLQDRNHPSIFLWSVGNEVENQGQPSMLAMLKQLTDYCRKLDPTRPVTCALEPHNVPISLREGPIEDKVEHTKKMAELVDILGLNYQEQWYEQYREAMPDTLIVGTETFPYYRGEGNRVKGYLPVNPWFDVEKHDYVIGQFVWAGIDYLGEASYPYKGWASGLIDTCAFRKPISYLQQSLWSEEPMVHIAVFDSSLEDAGAQWTLHWKSPGLASHWTFPEQAGRLIRLVTFTNCESVELFINDESYGVRKLSDYPNRFMEWHVPYHTGTIRAVGRNGDAVVSEHTMKTAGTPCRIVLDADRSALSANGRDIAHIEVRVVDEQGIIVPNTDFELSFDLQGEGEIIGVDNGDLRDHGPYKGSRRETRGGRCLVVVQSGPEAGELVIRAAADGLAEGELRIKVEE
ncbi:glycoside hydrolase family 2 TIM barrel-domain containing protein [Paenibacillus sp. XY044]|uniref:glycoside hydrolase family 2 TIM barrel-domain containing protein n=1 Tax=Paenibacillus sp. XY044 TaxID=2026089 RepID=UPI000B990D5B|nr:glycoside hydrolase family 2 TIM barrel-domain containing protein [Paenibacillus sp. XY044]OZB98626.1 glycoside hydrolase family 2 [Paenibacillus sp. XY044]